MKKILIIIIAIAFILFLLTTCEENNNTNKASDIPENLTIIDVNKNIKPMDDRLLGINVSENVNGFYDSFEELQRANVDIIELNIPWNLIEVDTEKYEDPMGLLSAISFYGENNIKVSLSIAVINTFSWETPEDLKLGDENFTERFNKMIDFVLETVPDNVEIISISIGNEVDFVLQDNEWEEYTSFFKEAKTHLKSVAPQIKAGCKTTVMTILMTDKIENVKELNSYADVVMLNYYPQNDKFEVMNPDIVYEHFDFIAETFPNKEIWLTEVGYQSGENYCKSSEQKQAEFYHHLFNAWDEHSKHITVVQIDWLHDQSRENIEDFKAYYGSDEALVEYLSTLGLRNYDDTDKLAFKQILSELEKR